MTPAINLVEQHKIAYQVHSYDHDPKHPSFGLEAAEKLKVNPDQVFKTLVVSLENQSMAVAVLPVIEQLNLKLLAKFLGVKKVSMADAATVQRSSGYLLGGVSPLAQKKKLPTIIDQSALSFTTIFISAGRRGLEIELSPVDLRQLTSGLLADIT